MNNNLPFFPPPQKNMYASIIFFLSSFLSFLPFFLSFSFLSFFFFCVPVDMTSSTPLLKRRFVQVGETPGDNEGTFSVLQFNTLADCNATTSAFPKVPEEFLDWKKRVQPLLDEIFGYDADFICLQEVDPKTIDFIKDFINYHLRRPGRRLYSMTYILKRDGREGILLLYKEKFYMRAQRTLDHAIYSGISTNFQGNQKSTICHFHFADNDNENDLHYSSITIAVTHLKSKAGFEKRRLFQGKTIVGTLGDTTIAGYPIIIAGDFNAEPDEEVMEEFTHAGFKSAYCIGGRHPDFTSFKYKEDREQLRTIDYILHNQEARPIEILEIPDKRRLQGHDGTSADHIGLPSATYPSDHVALFSRFAYQKGQALSSSSS